MSVLVKLIRIKLVEFLFVTLYNKCLSEGVFPNAYKIAQVIPLFKGGDKENVNSYRPISLLPVLGKLLEKLISKHLISVLDKHIVLKHCWIWLFLLFSSFYIFLLFICVIVLVFWDATIYISNPFLTFVILFNLCFIICQ